MPKDILQSFINNTDKKTFRRMMKDNAFGDVVASTLDTVAYEHMMKGRDTVDSMMTLRNKWTKQGISYSKAKKNQTIKKTTSMYGADTKRYYLAMQEEGYYNKYMLPTLAARTGTNRQKNIKKALRLKYNRISKIRATGRELITRLAELSDNEEYRYGKSMFIDISKEIGRDIKIPSGIYQFNRRKKNKGRAYRHLRMIYNKEDTEGRRNKIRSRPWMSDTNKKMNIRTFMNAWFNNLRRKGYQ